jgi:AbrB family looped-hinge helix DNA binding protein
MALSRVQARGQVTIPADVRRAAGVEPGDRVVIMAIGKGQIRLTSVPAQVPLDELFKRYSGPGVVPVDLWERVEEDIARDVLRRAGVVAGRPRRARKKRR